MKPIVDFIHLYLSDFILAVLKKFIVKNKYKESFHTEMGEMLRGQKRVVYPENG